MGIKDKWKRAVSGFLVICLLVVGIVGGLKQPVSAAAKSYVLEKGKTHTIQLDGKGAKEKIRFEVESEEIPDQVDSLGDPVFHNILTVYVNGKSVYETQAETDRFAAVGQMYVTSIDNSDKVRDIFIAMTGNVYVDTYSLLEYCRFENGKMEKKQDLKNYLDKTLPKDITDIPDIPEIYNNSYTFYHSMWDLDRSICTSGNKELLILIDLPGIYASDFGQFHADYALKLNDGKLVKKNKIPQGKCGEIGKGRSSSGEYVKVDKKSVFYASIGSSKQVFTVKKGGTVYLKEYKYVNGVLYLKGESQKKNSMGIEVPSGKTGWIESSKFYGYTGNHV